MPGVRKELREGHGEDPNGVRTPEWTAWRNMRNRCLNPKAVGWERYGGRGITVCERWSSYRAFLADMGRKPSPEHSLERIDNAGNYEPGNCHWATIAEQTRNRRSNVWIEAQGRRLTLEDWAKELGCAPSAITYRLGAGWDPAKAVTTPVRRYRVDK